LPIKKLTLCALLIALSYVLSYVSIFGTIAFDSLPAFVGGLALGGGYGALIGAIGHLFTASLKGFPYGIMPHFTIAILMALDIFLYTVTYNFILKKGSRVAAIICAAIVGALINGPVAVMALRSVLLPIMGAEALVSFTVVLTVAALANIVLAFILYFMMEKAKVAEKLKNL
jgi:hypothetical protein